MLYRSLYNLALIGSSQVSVASCAYGPMEGFWTLSTDRLTSNHYQSSPYVSNGYFGQRLPAEGVGHFVYRDDTSNNYVLNSWPLDQPRATFGTIAGFWDVQQDIPHPLSPGNLERGGESVISGIPNWTGLTVTTTKGHSYQPGIDLSTVKSFYQSTSIQNGIVHTNVSWAPTDETARYQLDYTVVAHRSRLNLGLVRLDIRVDEDVDFKVTDILDGAGAVRADFHEKSIEDDAMIFTSVKPLGINYCTAYVVSAVNFESTNEGSIREAKASRHDGGHYAWVSTNSSTVAQTWNWSLKQGDVLTVYKYVGLASTTVFQDNAFSVAKSTAETAKQSLWEELISEHMKEWDATWEDADIIIPENRDLQLRTRASIFHILSSMLPEDTGFADNSIMVGGLSSDSYAGLIFWDAETWIYPSLLALYPQYAAGINNYRGKLFDQALQNAEFYDFAGALFPWTSGRFGNCTGTGVCKNYQYHINSDIALAHWQYFLQTKDLSWLAERGWPIISSAAEMFAKYVSHNPTTGKYETIRIGEPDEFAYNINNGAFTNTAIKLLLGDWAPSAARALNLDVPENWLHVAENMYIPYSEEEQITIEFDGMNGLWQVKQASVGLINYPLQFQKSQTQARNDVAYYSSVNTANGPAMTWSIYSISEAQLQQKGCAAYTYLQRSSEPYIRSPFYQFSEVMLDTELEGVDNPAFIFGLSPAFPFLTGAGGFLQVLTHGLTGMRPNKDVFYLDPVLPPQLPGGLDIKGIKWQGASFDVDIRLEGTTVTRRSNSQTSITAEDYVTVQVHEENSPPKEYRLSVGESIRVTTRRPDVSAAPEDLALCKKVTSDQDWAPGNYAYAMVDGSQSTLWQPTSPTESSALIDLGMAQKFSKIRINWAAIPPRQFRLWARLHETGGFEALTPSISVDISAPFDLEEAKIVRIREGNRTEVGLDAIKEARFVKLTMEGSYAEDGLGATVAEVQVVGIQHSSTSDGREMQPSSLSITEKIWTSIPESIFHPMQWAMQFPPSQ